MSIFENNLKALRERYPVIEELMMRSEEIGHLEIFKASDGSPAFGLKTPAGIKPIMDHINPMQRIQAQLSAHSDKLSDLTRPILLIGLNPGNELLYLYDICDKTAQPRAEQKIYVIIDSLAALYGFMGLYDAANIINSDRVKFFWHEDISTFIKWFFDHPEASHFMTYISGCTIGTDNNFMPHVMAMINKRDADTKRYQAENEAYYDSITDEQLAAVISGQWTVDSGQEVRKDGLAARVPTLDPHGHTAHDLCAAGASHCSNKSFEQVCGASRPGGQVANNSSSQPVSLSTCQPVNRSARKPRLLMPTSTWTTVTQYSARDTKAAMEKAGWEVLHLNADQMITPYYLSRTINEFKPDVLININHLRTEALTQYPKNLFYITWIQDTMPAINNSEAATFWNKMAKGQLTSLQADKLTSYKAANNVTSEPVSTKGISNLGGSNSFSQPVNLSTCQPVNSQGGRRRDLIIGYVNQLEKYGYAKDRLVEMPMIVNPDIFKPRKLTKAQKEKYGCDVMFASNRSKPSDKVLEEDVMPILRKYGFADAMGQAIHDHLWKEYRAEKTFTSYQALEQELRSVDSRQETVDRKDDSRATCPAVALGQRRKARGAQSNSDIPPPAEVHSLSVPSVSSVREASFSFIYDSLSSDQKDEVITTIFWRLNDTIYRHVVLEWLVEMAEGHSTVDSRQYSVDSKDSSRAKMQRTPSNVPNPSPAPDKPIDSHQLSSVAKQSSPFLNSGSSFQVSSFKFQVSLDAPRIKLHLYGIGWENHPRFAKYAKGELKHGEELSIAYQAARYCLQLSSSEGQHQRISEIISSGGTILTRIEPRCYDHIDPILRKAQTWLLARINRMGSEHLAAFDLKELADAKQRDCLTDWLFQCITYISGISTDKENTAILASKVADHVTQSLSCRLDLRIPDWESSAFDGKLMLQDNLCAKETLTSRTPQLCKIFQGSSSPIHTTVRTAVRDVLGMPSRSSIETTPCAILCDVISFVNIVTQLNSDKELVNDQIQELVRLTDIVAVPDMVRLNIIKALHAKKHEDAAKIIVQGLDVTTCINTITKYTEVNALFELLIRFDFVAKAREALKATIISERFSRFTDMNLRLLVAKASLDQNEKERAKDLIAKMDITDYLQQPPTTEQIFRLCNVFIRCGKDEDSLRILEQYIKTAPSDQIINIHANIARSVWRNDFRRIIPWMECDKKYDCQSEDGLLDMALAYAAVQKESKGETLIERAYRCNRKLQDGYSKIAWNLYWPQWRFKEALRYFEMDEKRNRLSMRMQYAQCLAANGQTACALEVACENVRDPEERANAYAQVAYACRFASNHEAAKDLFQNAVDMGATLPVPAWTWIAENHLFLNEYKEAATIIRRNRMSVGSIVSQRVHMEFNGKTRLQTDYNALLSMLRTCTKQQGSGVKEVAASIICHCFLSNSAAVNNVLDHFHAENAIVQAEFRAKSAFWYMLAGNHDNARLILKDLTVSDLIGNPNQLLCFASVISALGEPRKAQDALKIIYSLNPSFFCAIESLFPNRLIWLGLICACLGHNDLSDACWSYAKTHAPSWNTWADLLHNLRKQTPSRRIDGFIPPFSLPFYTVALETSNNARCRTHDYK